MISDVSTFKFMLSVEEFMNPPDSKLVCTVNDVLMSVSRDRSKFPSKKQGKNCKDDFSSPIAESDGYEVENALTNCLWMINANNDNLG